MIDDHIAVVGSFNLDMRSVYLDTELMLVIDSKEVAGMLGDAWTITRRKQGKQIRTELMKFQLGGAEKNQRKETAADRSDPEIRKKSAVPVLKRSSGSYVGADFDALPYKKWKITTRYSLKKIESTVLFLSAYTSKIESCI